MHPHVMSWRAACVSTPVPRPVFDCQFHRCEWPGTHFAGDVVADARGHHAARDDAWLRDPYFDQAELALQVAIVLASVTMLSGRRRADIVSLLLAVIGALFTANGFFLFDGGRLLNHE
jgi:hypothetical protein